MKQRVFRGKRIRPSGQRFSLSFYSSVLTAYFTACCRTVSCEDNPAGQLAGL